VAGGRGQGERWRIGYGEGCIDVLEGGVGARRGAGREGFVVCISKLAITETMCERVYRTAHKQYAHIDRP